jgi:hypothetical protein
MRPDGRRGWKQNGLVDESLRTAKGISKQRSRRLPVAEGSFVGLSRRPPPLFGRRPSALGLQPRGFCRPAWLSRFSLLPHGQCGCDDRPQPLSHVFAVPKLAASTTRNEAQPPARIYSRPQTLQQLCPLLRTQGGRARHVPPHLYPCRGCVHMLPARTPRSGGSIFQLSTWEAKLPRDLEQTVVHHGLIVLQLRSLR